MNLRDLEYPAALDRYRHFGNAARHCLVSVRGECFARLGELITQIIHPRLNQRKGKRIVIPVEPM